MAEGDGETMNVISISGKPLTEAEVLRAHLATMHGLHYGDCSPTLGGLRMDHDADHTTNSVLDPHIHLEEL